MALTYRSVKGSQLTSAEGDANIETLHGFDSHWPLFVNAGMALSGGEGISTFDLVNWVNTRPAPIEVLENHGQVWFTALYSAGGKLYRYMWAFRGGRGEWGAVAAGGTMVITNLFALFSVGPASSDDIINDGVPQYVEVTLSGGQTVSEWLNTQFAPVPIQSQSVGLTFFEDEGAGLTWLWVGTSGLYGAGQLQSDDDDFQEIAASAAEAVVPSAQQTFEVSPVVSVTPQFTDNAGNIMGMLGNRLKVQFSNGKILNWVLNQVENDFTLTFPALTHDENAVYESSVFMPVTVPTYADAVLLFTGAARRRVYVDADEAHYDGLPSFYDYEPGKGAALMGVDFDYMD